MAKAARDQNVTNVLIEGSLYLAGQSWWKMNNPVEF